MGPKWKQHTHLVAAQPHYTQDTCREKAVLKTLIKTVSKPWSGTAAAQAPLPPGTGFLAK